MRDWLKTSLPLIYHPAEVALAALKSSVKSINKEKEKANQSDATTPPAKHSLDSFLNLAFQGNQQEMVRLAKTCKEIESAVSLSSKDRLKGEQLKTEATRINNKLTLCGNPEKERSHPHYELIQNAKRVETDRIKQHKATKIAEEERQKQAELLGLSSTSSNATGQEDAASFQLSTRPAL